MKNSVLASVSGYVRILITVIGHSIRIMREGCLEETRSPEHQSRNLVSEIISLSPPPLDVNWKSQGRLVSMIISPSKQHSPLDDIRAAGLLPFVAHAQRHERILDTAPRVETRQFGNSG